MAIITDTTYQTAEFKGCDMSSPTRKNTTRDWGGVQVGYNYENGDHGEVLIVVDNALTKGSAMTLLSKPTAMDLLLHLNDLLGNPLSHPATAGGFAPSAD